MSRHIGLVGIPIPVWVPTDYPNLIVWLEADRGTYQDAALTTPAIVDADPVGGWEDQSGHGNHLSQTAGARPTLKLLSNGIGGQAALDFVAASSQFLERPTLTDGDIAQPTTIYVVFKHTTIGTIQTVFGGVTNITRNDLYLNTLWYLYAGGAATGADNTGDIFPHVLSAVFDGVSTAGYLDGYPSISGNGGSNALRGLRIGADFSADYLNGMVSALLIYHEAHDATKRAQVTSYLQAKYSSLSPQPYQVFQRNGSDQANIPIYGYYASISPVSIEASFNGGAYQTIATSVNGAFAGVLLNQAAGQGTLTLRVAGTAITLTIPHVGIGDIFLLMGQSNCVGQYNNNQVYTHASLKAGLLGNDYRWRELVDPVDTKNNQIDTVSRDSLFGGSVWPLLATDIMASTGFPVAFIPCALSNTIISQWIPGVDHRDRTTLYGSAVNRGVQAVGLRAVLYWQGESDVLAGTSTPDYLAAIQTIGDALYADLGVSTLNAKIHDYSGYNAINYANIQAAIGSSWGTHHLLQGADLSGLASANLDLKTDGEAASCAAAWWSALQAAFGW